MTASGNCRQCGKVATSFHYNKPYDGNGHDGFWHCDEHGPVMMRTGRRYGKTFASKQEEEIEKQMEGMGRRQRREFQRFMQKQREKIGMNQSTKLRVLTLSIVIEQGSEDAKWLWKSATQGRLQNGILVRGMVDGDMIAANVELTKKIQEQAEEIEKLRGPRLVLP